MATAASPGKKPMNKETPSYSMFAVSNDKWHGIVRITGHDPGVQARGPPPRKGAFSLHTLIPLNSFFCYLLQEPLWQQRGSTLCVKPANKIKNAHAAYNDCATL